MTTPDYKPGDPVEVMMSPRKRVNDLDAWEWRRGKITKAIRHMDGTVVYEVKGRNFLTRAPAHCMRLKPSEEE